MDAALQRRVQRYGWDKAAAWYEQYWQNQLEPAQTRLLQLANLQSGEKVLDIACGTGRLSFRMAESVMPNGTVTATDISDRMIEFAARSATEKNISNISFQRMEAEELTIDNNAWDAVICSLGLMYVTDA